MSGFANTVFTLMIGWFQTVVSLIWSGLSDKNGGNVFTWIGNHWIVIVLILCAVGTIVDLSVYIARWKPLDVIRSYFDRKSGKITPNYHNSVPASGNDPVYPAEIMQNSRSAEDIRQPLFASNQPLPYSGDEPVSEKSTESGNSAFSDYDFLQEPSPARNHSGKNEVPSDSPYRRPLPVTQYEPEYESEKQPSERTPDPIVRPRRRRINVSELFGNPEEDMIHFEPPKPVIDKAEAYHTPVYPRNWKDNGETADDSGIQR